MIQLHITDNKLFMMLQLLLLYRVNLSERVFVAYVKFLFEIEKLNLLYHLKDTSII